MNADPFERARIQSDPASHQTMAALSEAVDGDMGKMKELIQKCDQTPVESTVSPNRR